MSSLSVSSVCLRKMCFAHTFQDFITIILSKAAWTHKGVWGGLKGASKWVAMETVLQPPENWRDLGFCTFTVHQLLTLYCAHATCVPNPVHGLLLTHHLRSLAHHMDPCTTLTVALHLKLQFPSSIALTLHTADCTEHTADCTDHTPYINQGLLLPLCRVLFSVTPLVKPSGYFSPIEDHARLLEYSSALPSIYLFASFSTLPVFLTMPINKSLHMDPHASRLVGPVTT